MEIVYLGHSAFRVRGKDATIVTDPYPPESGLAMGRVNADIVTISRPGPNGALVGAVGGSPRVVAGPGEYEVGGILITGVATAMEPGRGPRNTAYVMRVEEMAVCHLGNINTRLSNQQIEDLGEVDVLLVPTGGGNTLDPAHAAAVIAQVEPSLVIPMHYGSDGGTSEGLVPVDHFMREMGAKEYTVEPRLTVSRSALGAQVKIAVLDPRRL